MAKRIADKELTDRNWDQEEEGEEAGTFSVASDDVMKNRNIKKAKRRNTGAEAEGGTAFRGFKGFSLTSSAGGALVSKTVSSSFAGFKNLSSLTNGNNSSSFSGFSAPPTTTTSTGLVFNGPSSSSSTAAGGAAGGAGSSNKEYRRQLTALNVSVRDWITKHVNDNPLCDLNPIFRDYETHLASIERSYGSTPSEVTDPAPSLSEDKNPAPSSSLPAGVSFNFGQKVDSSLLTSSGSSSSTPSFSFSSTSLFGGVTTPLSFSSTKKEEVQPADENGEEESDDPPKPDVKEVKEDNAFYSKKCKLFYKKEAEFKEKGVGTLHLKETNDGKTQMIIRADTNLGNILLNVLLQASLPVSRVGRNNVMVVCVPNPPLDDRNPSSPVPLLIRVKTSEDADQLLSTLEAKKT